jgi:hypothetical protein
VCVLPIPSAHEAAGATGIRHSPRPLWAENSSNASGASRREDANVRLEFHVIASAAKQSILSLRLDGLLRFARNDSSTIVWLFESFGPSCPDLIRASIHLRSKLFSKMDHRVKPGDDDLEKSYFGCSFSAAELMQ